LGGDYYHVSFDPEHISYQSPTSAVNIYDPNAQRISLTPVPIFNINSIGNTDNYGAYIQDQIKLPFNVHVMGGLRYQYVHNTSSLTDLDTNVVTPNDPQTDDAVTPRVGILWQPQKWLSLYSNYAENFGANTGRGFLGKTLPPQSAQQFEGGIKTEFFDGRLRATLAYYDLTKQNVATIDPNHLTECGGACNIAVGEVRSRGPELDIQGEILPGWNVIATYANQDVHVSKDNSIPVGSRLGFVPRNLGSFWTSYEVQQGILDGFKIGGGVTLRDGVVDLGNTVKSPGYALVNLLAGYSFEVGKSKINLQLNVDNLLDKSYITDRNTSFGTYTYASFSTPRTFMGSINVQY
jgi:iron complex outermembrane recepter protein